MNVVALLMAGGKSSRMRACGDAAHKALRDVGGRTLFGRNLSAVLDEGFRDVVVAISPHETELEDHIQSVGHPLAAAHGANLEIIKESTPLGNIGAVGLIAGRDADVLVLFVDNLLALDLNDLLEFHRSGCYGVTFTTHEQRFADPYGELVLDGNEVRAYREKPTRTVWISSGACVVSNRIARATSVVEPTAMNELFDAALARGERVGAYRYRGPWIDVNDVASLERARALVSADADLFSVKRTV